MKSFNSKSGFHYIVGCSLGASFSLGAGLAFAEAQYAKGLEEIVVTASKREKNVQDVPIAINAFSADKVETLRIQDIQGISYSVPGFSVNSLGKSRFNPSLRGGSSSLVSAGAEQAVGLFIDDQYFGGAGDFELDLFDIERIEVLRGPQGTLFGRNTTGGSISVVTRTPSEELEGKLEATFGNYNAIEVRGYVSGPIADDLFGSVAFSSRQRDGTSENLLTGNDVEDTDRQSFRGKLLWDVSPELRITAALGFSQADELGQARDLILNSVPTSNNDLINAGFVPDNDPRKVQHSDGGYESEQWTANLRAAYQLSNASLLSITTYRDFDSKEEEASLVGSPVPIFELGEPRTVESFSQEFRFTSEYDGSFNFVSGLYYFESDETRDVSYTTAWDEGTVAGLVQALYFCPVQDDADFPFVSPACVTDYPELFGPNTAFINERNRTTSYSAFFDGTYQLTDSLTVFAGIRYTRDKKEFDVDVGGGPEFFWNPPTEYAADYPTTGDFTTGQSVSASDSWNKTTYRLGFQYDINDSAMVYGTYATGFRSGLYDGAISDPTLLATPLDPETAKSVEFGMKSRWLDDRLQLNLALFHVDYEDLQFFVADPLDGSTSTNAGEASVEGVEIELVTALNDYLTLSANYSHQEGDSSGTPPGVGIADGTPPQGTIPNTYMVALDFDYPLDNGSNINVHIDYLKKEVYNLEFNDAPQFESETDGLVNGSVGLTLASGLEFSLWGQNLTDEDVVLYGNDTWFAFYDFGADESVQTATSMPRYAPPRTYGVTVRYSF